jgi:hypothetical protein
MLTLADVFRFQSDYSDAISQATEAELGMISRRHNEVLQAVAEEHGLGSYAQAYSLPDTTELGEKSLPIFEGLKRDMALNAAHRITPRCDVRALRRDGNFLTHLGLKWLRAQEPLYLGPAETLIYDHQDQTVARVLDAEGERYVILSELDATPWHEDEVDALPVAVSRQSAAVAS